MEVESNGYVRLVFYTLGRPRAQRWIGFGRCLASLWLRMLKIACLRAGDAWH
jgi:hypothetical protein